MSMDDLMRALSDAQGVSVKQELTRIANAAELTAAIAAHDFFKERGAENAMEKLRAIIQVRASALCTGKGR